MELKENTNITEAAHKEIAKLQQINSVLLEALENCQLGIEKMIGWEEVNKQAINAINKAKEVSK